MAARRPAKPWCTGFSDWLPGKSRNGGGKGSQRRSERRKQGRRARLGGNRLLAEHLGDGGKRGARVGEVPLAAQRVGLVEKLVDLVDVGFTQGVGLELVTHGPFDRGQLRGAFVVFVHRIGVRARFVAPP